MLTKVENKEGDHSLQDQFELLDKHGTGLVNKEDLKKAVIECSLEIDDGKLD